MKKTNIFGGKNSTGLYVPMTDDEMDALDRMIQSENLQLIIHGWGILDKPNITFGDLRVAIKFRLDFNAPTKPMDVYYFDLELKVRGSNITLFKKRMPSVVNGQPLTVQAGMFIDLVWDIAIDHIDPNLVKAYLPGLHGMTSRRLDKDTGERTLLGNMKLNENQKNHLKSIEEQNVLTKQSDTKKAIKATKQAGGEIKKIKNDYIADDVK